MKHLTLTLDPSRPRPATRDLPPGAAVPDGLPEAGVEKVSPRGGGGGGGGGADGEDGSGGGGGEDARLMFLGTATTVLYVFFLCFSGVCGLGMEREGVR